MRLETLNQFTSLSINIEECSEISFREKVYLEELGSEFFISTHKNTIEYLTEAVNTHDFNQIPPKVNGISNNFFRFAMSRPQVDFNKLIKKIELDCFQRNLKNNNPFRDIDSLKDKTLYNLAFFYKNMLFICDRYLKTLNQPFSKGIVDDGFIAQILDAFIDSVIYDGHFYSDHQKRYDNWLICVLKFVRKSHSHLTIRNKLNLFNNQFHLLCKYETGRSGIDFIQSPQLRMFLNDEIENLNNKIEKNAQIKFNFDVDISSIKELHQILFEYGYIDTKSRDFVLCWELGEGKINWLKRRSSLVLFHTILRSYTTLLDNINIENFIYQNYTHLGETEFNISSFIKKGLNNPCPKKYKIFFKIISTLPDKYIKNKGE
ncbi:hypothetical protein LX69_00453 [Breznakibacter xylanolyticus]|uniref:Uncharacterized protein n=1 Tax=Breznakibacter xylanolyticus TaxID=990 RepID=A0A2W7NKL1_9BACT|nr:hypothetical protein [Breznakibacter xylanolyticus]PZX20003.1 hypothetical protein LX69_00453 [Breznakibacter xylanolyticus]